MWSGLVFIIQDIRPRCFTSPEIAHGVLSRRYQGWRGVIQVNLGYGHYIGHWQRRDAESYFSEVHISFTYISITFHFVLVESWATQMIKLALHIFLYARSRRHEKFRYKVYFAFVLLVCCVWMVSLNRLKCESIREFIGWSIYIAWNVWIAKSSWHLYAESVLYMSKQNVCWL